MKLENTRL